MVGEPGSAALQLAVQDDQAVADLRLKVGTSYPPLSPWIEAPGVGDTINERLRKAIHIRIA
jgi:hypothetical protein